MVSHKHIDVQSPVLKRCRHKGWDLSDLPKVAADIAKTVLSSCKGLACSLLCITHICCSQCCQRRLVPSAAQPCIV